MNRYRINRTLRETLLILCEKEGEDLFKNGEIRQMALSRKTGVPQSALSRLLGEERKSLSEKNTLKLAKYFKINSAQMRGEQAIDHIDGAMEADDVEFIERFKSHPDELKHALKAFEHAWLSKP